MSRLELDHVQIAAPPGCKEAGRSWCRAQGPPVLRVGSAELDGLAHSEDPWGNRIQCLAAIG